MRDPRSGFATGICHHAATNEAPLAIGVLGLLLCCACGGATTASVPERSPASPVTVEQSATPTPAPQQSAPRVVGLRYGAPPECPDVERYAGHVRSRSANLSIQPAADALVSADAVSVQVQPAPDASGWLGRVSITGPLALDREVRGARCEDVVAALALITVLRLEGADASALAGSSVAGTTSPTNAGSGTTGATAGATAREGDPPRAATPVAEAPSAPSPEAAANTDAASTRANAETSGTAAATPPSGPAPELTPEAPASEPSATATPTPDPSPAELEREAADDGRAPSADGTADAMSDGVEAAREGAPAASPRAPAAASRATDIEADSTSVDSSQAASAPPWRWPSVSAAAVSLRAGYASVPGHAFQAALEGELRLGEGWVSELSLAYARGKDEVDLAKLDLRLLTIDVGLCPLELGAGAPVWLRACAGLRGGALHLEISPTQGGLSEASVWRPWASLTPSLRFGVPLSERWTLRGLAELAVQLVRDNFDVELTAVDAAEARRFTVYRPEAISLELGLGVGYSF